MIHDPEELYVIDGGRYLATDPTGKRGRVIDSLDAELKPGWHLVTIAEMDARADEVTREALTQLVEEDPAFRESLERKIADVARHN
jgi:hypothetical protein